MIKRISNNVETKPLYKRKDGSLEKGSIPYSVIFTNEKGVIIPIFVPPNEALVKLQEILKIKNPLE